MSWKVCHPVVVATALTAGLQLPAAAQSGGSFERAMEMVRYAWLRHDIDALLDQSDTVRLYLPEGGQIMAIRPHHAVRVLKDYLRDARELDLSLRGVHDAGDGHRYAEMTRVFVVSGTSDAREQAVFFGLRLGPGGWAIREVRIIP